MSKKLFQVNAENIFLADDLDAWVTANQEWLVDFSNSTIHNFKYELVETGTYSARLDVTFNPDATRCASCEDAEITEGVCGHEWYESLDLKVIELWEKGD